QRRRPRERQRRAYAAALNSASTGRCPMTNREVLIAWLKDAHAMETGLIPVLQNHAGDAKTDPNAAARINQHVEETRRHAQMVEDCIQRLGDSVSGTKEAMGRVAGWFKSISSGAAR